MLRGFDRIAMRGMFLPLLLSTAVATAMEPDSDSGGEETSKLVRSRSSSPEPDTARIPAATPTPAPVIPVTVELGPRTFISWAQGFMAGQFRATSEGDLIFPDYHDSTRQCQLSLSAAASQFDHVSSFVNSRHSHEDDAPCQCSFAQAIRKLASPLPNLSDEEYQAIQLDRLVDFFTNRDLKRTKKMLQKRIETDMPQMITLSQFPPNLFYQSIKRSIEALRTRRELLKVAFLSRNIDKINALSGKVFHLEPFRSFPAYVQQIRTIALQEMAQHAEIQPRARVIIISSNS